MKHSSDDESQISTHPLFLSMKMEWVLQRDYANHSKAIHDVTDYIVNFYSAVRLYSKLEYLSPNAFEHKSATQPTY